MLPTIMDSKSRQQLLPQRLTSEDLRPRDRQEHSHLEPLLRLADMEQEMENAFCKFNGCLYSPTLSLPFSMMQILKITD